MTKAWLKNTMNKVGKTKRKHKLEVIETPKREVITVPGLLAIPKMDLVIKPDYERLIMLLNTRTYSRGKLQDKLIEKLDEHFSNLGAVTEKDSYGNLYVTKGNAEFYPCVVGHTDINQQERANVKIVSEYPWMFGFDLNKAEQAGMGADDKVGVYFAVHMFDLFDNIKLFFPKDEEIGLVGTYEANKEFFTDCSMLVQLDRNSYKNDLINYTNGIEVCSEEFVTAAKPIMDKYMYATNRGSCTDIGGIKKFNTVNCVAMNVSCGYINEHSSEEVISMPHFENAINFGYELLKMGVDKVWSHSSKEEVYEQSYYGMFGRGYYATTNTTKPKSIFDNDIIDDSVYFEDSPGGLVQLEKIDRSQNNYMLELYPEYKDETVRINSLTHTINYFSQEHEMEGISQAEIDETIADGFCPNCFSPIQTDNSLLLYTYCQDCDSTFNLPK